MTTSCYLPVFYCFGCCSHQNNRCSQFVLLKFSQLFRSSLQNAPHFVGVAYPPNKILKTVLKMQAFYVCFIKFCLSLNNYKFSGLFYCSIVNVLVVFSHVQLLKFNTLKIFCQQLFYLFLSCCFHLLCSLATALI